MSSRSRPLICQLEAIPDFLATQTDLSPGLIRLIAGHVEHCHRRLMALADEREMELVETAAGRTPDVGGAA